MWAPSRLAKRRSRAPTLCYMSSRLRSCHSWRGPLAASPQVPAPPMHQRGALHGAAWPRGGAGWCLVTIPTNRLHSDN